MPRYRFSVYDQHGTLTKGTIEAPTRKAALDMLHLRGQLALDLEEDTGLASAGPRWWEREITFGSGGLPIASLALFTREMATLVKADLTVDKALSIVAVQPMIPRRTRQAAAALNAAVREGQPLSSALAQRAPEFPEYYWRLVQAGEVSGTLGEVLDNLAGFLERTGETRSQITSALLYPAVLLVAAVAAIAVIMGVLVPTLVPLFSDAGAPLPPALRFLVDVQAFVSSHWLALAGGLAVLLVLALLGLRSPALRLSLHRLVLRVPIVGQLIAERETARFARTLATLARNGVAMLDAVRISGNVLQNRAFALAVANAGQALQEGRGLSEPLHESGLFADLAMSLVTVGEQTGQLEPMLMRVAEVYESMVQRRLSRLLSLLTPVLTLVIGGLVGALILSVMNAILSVNELPGL